MKKLLITLPCYNEELVLEKTVFTLVEYARANLAAYDWKILVIDNNSKDRTPAIAEKLRADSGGRVIVETVRAPGRGIAVRTAWLALPGYDIYSYMDTDLATDIKDFSFIVKKVDEGYDLATGSRYLPHSDVQRTFKRKVLSKAYNMLLKAVLKVDFMDAQCGFKAMSARLIKEVFPETHDDGWFWDAETMILACRGGYRVLEVPVTWREVRDELRASKVSVWSEVVKNLGNIYRMRARLATYNGRATS